MKMRDINILVACEESQRVCEAFRKLGGKAYSCDIMECSGGASRMAHHARCYSATEWKM